MCTAINSYTTSGETGLLKEARQRYRMAAQPVPTAPVSAAAAPLESTHFIVMVTGQIESGRFEGHDSLYCRYAFAHGDDWKVARGVEEGITQMSTASRTAADAGRLAVWNFPVDVTFKATGAHGWPQIILSVYGSDAFGRSDMIIGYGAMHLCAPHRANLTRARRAAACVVCMPCVPCVPSVACARHPFHGVLPHTKPSPPFIRACKQSARGRPLTPGRHELYVRTFRPLASSLFGRFQSWLLGARPEFRDTHFPAKGEGRDVTRVQSFGCVKVVCDVTLQGMEELGYAVPAPVRPAVRVLDPFTSAGG